MPRAGLDLERIIQTAAALADQQGTEAVTLAAIAREFSVRPSSLFNHVKGLPQIKRELTLLGVKKLYAGMKVASDGKSGEEAIFAIADAYLQFTREHPGLYEYTIAIPQQTDEEIEIESNKIIELIIASFGSYPLSEVNAIHAVRGLRSILHGFSTLEQIGGFGMPIDRDDSLVFMIRAFLNGLKEVK